MSTASNWIAKLDELRASRTSCVMVVVTATDGSTPRETGARMLVDAGGLAWGTIGGGKLEQLALEKAAQLLASESSEPESVRYPLAEAAGQCCGGSVTVFFEPFHWTRHTVVVFGAGHVGQALSGLAPWMQADVQLIDGREEAEIRPALSPSAAERPFTLTCIDAPESEIDAIPERALVVIMTHNHALDLELLERALKRGTFPYVGMIGSTRKWERFLKLLAAKGFAAEAVANVRCPIGVTRTSKTPTAIALSVATELVDVMARLEVERAASNS